MRSNTKILSLEDLKVQLDGLEELDTSDLILTDKALAVLERLLLMSHLEKYKINSLQYNGDSARLLRDLEKKDIEIVTYQYLIDTATINKTLITE